MAEVTKKTYAAAIPKCCTAETLEQHEFMGYCWSLVRSIDEDKPMDCGGCELRRTDGSTAQRNGGES